MTSLEVDPPLVRILLVEDDDGDAFLVEELLGLAEGIEAEVVRASTLASAARLAPAGFDCILLDLGLPDGRGEDAVQAALGWNSSAAIVVLTGHIDHQLGLHAVAIGAQDFLQKGTVNDFLLAKSILYAISRRRAEETALRLLESQLREATNSRIGRSLLPHPLVRSGDIAIATRYHPGSGFSVLGGDFVDVIELDDGTWRAVIGDVAGHGPDEAALGVSLRVGWRSLVLAGLDQAVVLRCLQRLLEVERQDEAVFASALDLEISPDRRTMRIMRAGHPPPLLLAPVLAELHTPGGPVLGIVDEPCWPRNEVELEPGWRCMLYTDGLIEGRLNGGRERLGIAGLCHLLATVGADRDDHNAMVAEVLAMVIELNGGPLDDDVAVVVLVDNGS